MPKNTAIAIISGKPVTLEVLLEKSKGEIQKVLPLHIPVDRFIRVAITTVRKSEALQNCNALSIVGCIMESAQLGLEISGVLGHAYMVPYGTEAQLQIGYRGFAALANNSDKIDWCDGKVVYEGDEFDYQFGTDPYIKHIPCGETDFEKVTHAYFITKLMSGSAVFNVWPVDKILAHRDKYSKAYQKKKEDNAWVLAPEPMYIKTVARPTLKLAPISNSLQRAIGLDEQAEAGIPQQLAKTLSDSIIGAKDEVSGEGPTPEVSDVDHNRDEYPSRGKHSENGKEPSTYRNIPYHYLEWGRDKLSPCEMKDRILAEIQARKLDEGSKEKVTDAEFENDVIPENIEKLLEHPVLSEEEVNEWVSLIKNEKNPPEEWLARQESIIKGLIADKEQEKQGSIL